MRSDATVIVDAMSEAEDQLAITRDARVRFADAIARRSFVDLAVVAPELQAAVRALMQVARRIEAEITACDRDVIGDEVESVEELAVRAASIAIARELDHLRFVLGDDAPPDRARHLFSGRLRTMADVAGHVRRQLVELNAGWIAHRRPPVAPVPIEVDGDDFTAAAVEGERRVLYRVAIRGARRALGALGEDRALAHFIRAGTACEGWPEVSLPCAIIGRLIGVPRRLDAAPAEDLALTASVDAEPAWREAGGAP